MHIPMRANLTATFVEEDGASNVRLNGSLCGQREYWVGTSSESSHIATEPLKQIEVAVPTL